MCLRTNDATVHVAKKNIIVFKQLIPGNRSAIQDYPYTKNELNREEELEPIEDWPIEDWDDSVSKFRVNSGYHSRNACDFFYTSLFIIPKGTQYIEGFFNNSKVERNRVSSNIVYIGSMWNPFNWIKALLWEPTKK